MSKIPALSGVRLFPRDTAFLDRKVGDRGEIFYNEENDSLRLYNGRTTGGSELAKNTLINVDADDVRKKVIESLQSTVVYSVTIAGPQGSDSGNKYILNGNYKPSLNFVVGYTYIFNQTDLTNVYYPNVNGTTVNAHPLNFSDNNLNGDLGTGGRSYFTDVIYKLNGKEVTQTVYASSAFNTATSRSVQITVTNATPAGLYYWCYNHQNMGNAIAVADPGSGSGSVSGGSSVSVADTAPESPELGSIWLNTNSGILYVYVDDQWMQPASPSADLSSLSPVAFSGDYNDLDSTPLLADVAASGSYLDLSDLPFVPAELNDLNDVNTATSPPQTGEVLRWNGTFWEPGQAAAPTGNFVFTNSEMDSSDSSSITIVPAVTFNSDATVENELFVNTIVSASSLTLKSNTVNVHSFASTTEVIENITQPLSAGVVDHDISLSSLFYHDAPSFNFTVNFKNFPVITSSYYSLSVSLIINQPSTARMPIAVQLEGVENTIKWLGASGTPAGNDNNTDIVSFTLLCIDGTWSVLASLSTYG